MSESDHAAVCLRHSNGGRIRSKGGMPDLGDWLGPEYGHNDPEYLWTAYQVRDLEILAKTAAVLGKSDDAARYQRIYNERKAWFNDHFVRDGHSVKYDGTIMDTQTAQAVPLALGIFSEANTPAMADRLAQAVTRANVDDKGVAQLPYSLMTGFIGTGWISEALTGIGRSDLAYKMLENESYPSWLFPVNIR